MSDHCSFIFLLTLMSISVSVLTWSYYYIDSDLLYRRFLNIILLFLGSMFLLVFSADLLCLFVAWDLLGFTSFFLVIFYRSRASIGGGLLTGLTNRLGDVFLLLLFGLVGYSSSSPLSWSLCILMVVSFTNSAQVPFSSWLPAAMLAPTPVSALVHSSTLVTAGVYLLFRYGPSECLVLSFIGSLTTFLAGLAAFQESDINNIIALSTLSQLGLIVTALGIGVRSLCFAHLNIHAAFNALLFLAVGTVIHTMYGSQESRSTGFLFSVSPTVLIIALAASLSMCGLVFLSGWVTKEAILDSCLNSNLSVFTLLLFYGGIGLTLVYCLQLSRVFLSSLTSANCLSVSFTWSWAAVSPMFFPFVLSVVQGYTFCLSCFMQPSVLSLADKFVVWGVFAASFAFIMWPASNSTSFPSPLVSLCSLTSFLSSGASPASRLHYTEVSGLQGLGLAEFTSLVAPISIGHLFTSKFIVTLFFVIVLV